VEEGDSDGEGVEDGEEGVEEGDGAVDEEVDETDAEEEGRETDAVEEGAVGWEGGADGNDDVGPDGEEDEGADRDHATHEVTAPDDKSGVVVDEGGIWFAGPGCWRPVVREASWPPTSV